MERRSPSDRRAAEKAGFARGNRSAHAQGKARFDAGFEHCEGEGGSQRIAVYMLEGVRGGIEEKNREGGANVGEQVPMQSGCSESALVGNHQGV